MEIYKKNNRKKYYKWITTKELITSYQSKGGFYGKNDIRLMIGNIKFGARAVAVIENNNKILFQKRKDNENWALPGGAIATMEKGEEVVLRELEEETGETEAKIKRPLWFAEYFFTFGGLTQHQYILGYLVDIP